MSLKIFCDIADLELIKKFNKKKIVKGFTTNPSLMRKAGAKDYKLYSKKIISVCTKNPISVEVFADTDYEIVEQANKISKWAKNIYVKVPVINTKGKFLKNVITNLNKNKIKLNITAVFTLKQLRDIKNAINKQTPVIVSIFSGRIADSGTDPEPLIKKAKKLFKNHKNVKILWASVRESFNYIQAKRTKTDIITVPPKFIAKIYKKKIGLLDYSKDTVKQFFIDGKKSKFKI